MGSKTIMIIVERAAEEQKNRLGRPAAPLAQRAEDCRFDEDRLIAEPRGALSPAGGLFFDTAAVAI